MAKRAEPADRMLDAALKAVAERGWAALSMADIAAAAGVPLAQVHARFRSKSAILSAYGRRIDAAVLAEAAAPDAEDDARDRLFDILMLRFEVLSRDRDAVLAILADAPRQPGTALCALPSLVGSMGWMLEAAGLSASGWRGLLRAKGLAAVWLATLEAWRRDESEDLSRTMAALDRNLRRAAGLARLLDRGRWRAKAEPSPA
ncbi:MAG: TetR family transcriptional regulator [Alphaproteobacteria bacterium]